MRGRAGLAEYALWRLPLRAMLLLAHRLIYTLIPCALLHLAPVAGTAFAGLSACSW